MEATQLDLAGNPTPATGNWLLDQVAIILETYPETRDDNAMLEVRYSQQYENCTLPEADFHAILSVLRKRDLSRRRRELAALYPMKYGYSGAEAKRRKHMSKAGPLGRRK